MARQETPQERERAEKAELTAQYRAIGPAAILAALVCANDKRKAAAAPQSAGKAA